ncbi:MAG: DUF3021 domain-containing protein [Clostridia bacterium]|nr:DUF3021 domain-containing protein [Clostridia bacterium]
MKSFIYEFIRRGLTACGIGPVILGIVYLILQRTSDVHTLTVNQVCIGIFSVALLAFIAGGMNAFYQIERLPLMVSILIHGVVLYISYLVTYIVNNWLEWGMMPVLVFSGIFVIGYLIIWIIIYSVTTRKTKQLNKMLKEKQKNTGEQ